MAPEGLTSEDKLSKCPITDLYQILTRINTIFNFIKCKHDKIYVNKVA